MELQMYFTPVEGDLVWKEEKGKIGNRTKVYTEGSEFPDLHNAQLAIIGVEEGRGAELNAGCEAAPNFIRKAFYDLYLEFSDTTIVDLGNIAPGASREDTYFAVSTVVYELLRKNIVPIILGGSQEITFANYLAYQKLEQSVNVVSLDPGIDIGDVNERVSSYTWLSQIITHQPNFLFNYSNLGYQTYLAHPEIIDLMSKLYFDATRLGEIRSNIKETEPIIRNADLISIDLSVMKASDFDGHTEASPNGLYAEEICQICRYAGMSDKLTSFGIYEFNPEIGNTLVNSRLIAQMIWCFIEGYNNRKKDFPIGLKKDYLKYRVSMDEEHQSELSFYKSDKSERWWVEVPYPSTLKSRFERHHLIPCSYIDYEKALTGEVPDVYWQTYQKLV